MNSEPQKDFGGREFMQPQFAVQIHSSVDQG
jgi:hypothetical protein